MEKASISKLKNNLSAYLRKVRAGETILVVDRNHPVACIEAVFAVADNDRIARLETQGLLRRGARRPADLDEPPPAPVDEGGVVLAALLEERAQGR
jgi:antitoxin (DNA-binding transcriptional repressor) of toxin-antitoxin stability system